MKNERIHNMFLKIIEKNMLKVQSPCSLPMAQHSLMVQLPE